MRQGTPRGAGGEASSDREHVVCRVSELREAGALAVDVGDVRVALFWHDGAPHALSETCPHRGGPLHLGQVRSGIVRCPWHFWQFDLETGCSRANPNSCVPVYPTRVEGNTVLVRIAGPGGV